MGFDVTEEVGHVIVQRCVFVHDYVQGYVRARFSVCMCAHTALQNQLSDVT